MSGIVRFLTCISCLAAFGHSASAQESVRFATVSGRVLDATGAVLPGAVVSAREAATTVVTNSTTDEAGRFRFRLLPPGAYEFRAELQGFKPATRVVTLVAGSAHDLTMSLTVGAVESVLVIIDGSLSEGIKTQSSVTLFEQEVRTLPMNGRNFLDLALFVPGVSPTNVGGGTQLFPETSAVPGVGLSVASQRNLSNNFMVDGLSANDDAAALSGISFSVDAIEQFQVVTSGGQAELGRALGGHVNVTTRSGTNFWRVDGLGFFRDDRFDGRNKLSGTKLPMHQNQFGGSVGGPILPGRSWFFVNLERKALDQSGLVTISAANASAINARLDAVGYGGPPVATGIYSNPIDTTHGLIKVDHFLSTRVRMDVKYSRYAVSSDNARGAGGTSAPSASAGLRNLDQSLSAGLRLVPGARTVFEARGQVSHGDLSAEPTDLLGPNVSISGVATFGRLSSSPTGRRNTLYQLVGNLMYLRGAHSIKAGVDLLHNDDTITFPRAVRGSYAFSSLANFMNGVYNNNGFTQTFGDTVVAQTNPNVGLYVQDLWRAGSSLTVNAGLRYELQSLETINTDRNNLSPRLGVSWSPSESSTWVVRASGGRFYDRVPLRAVANALLSAGNTTDLARLRQVGVSLSPAQTGAPVFPNVLSGVVPTTTLVNLTTIDRNLQNAYSDQFSTELERQISRTGTVTVGYQYLRGRGLLMQINQNVPTCAVSGSNNGCRPVAAYANNNQYSAAGRSVYNGLHLSLVQRPAKWGSYRLSYTYSKSLNNLGETFFASPIDPTDVEKDWGRSDDDQRHRLVATGVVHTPSTPGRNLWEKVAHGFEFSGTVQYYSALPFNITTGANTIQGTAARPVVAGVFVPRNSGQASPFSTTSLRVLRRFAFRQKSSLEAMLEIFNLFDRRNDLARVTVFGSGAYPASPAANFGQVTVVGEPRSIQFGFRVRY